DVVEVRVVGDQVAVDPGDSGGLQLLGESFVIGRQRGRVAVPLEVEVAPDLPTADGCGGKHIGVEAVRRAEDMHRGRRAEDLGVRRGQHPLRAVAVVQRLAGRRVPDDECDLRTVVPAVVQQAVQLLLQGRLLYGGGRAGRL